MENADSLALIAARICAAWQSGRICSLIGRGCRVRVLRLGRLIEDGRLDASAGLRTARETEAMAFCFAPLPGGRS